MSRSAVIWFSLILALTSNVASARWFTLRFGRSRLSQIARSLVAAPDGEIKQDGRLTRDPESPTPPSKEVRRKHAPMLTAESAKCEVFSGPGEHTALIEVGLDAARVKGGDLVPTVSEILFAPTVAPARTGTPAAPTGQGTTAPAPANGRPGTGAGAPAPTTGNRLPTRGATP